MQSIPPEQSLIEYPSLFPIKVMGGNVDGFTEAVLDVARRFDPMLDPAAIETRLSSGNKYLAITVTVTATSREQLDDLYRALSSHPLVKVVL
jgi:putative lipoic acid-binding regulatory protein